jgi:hypothetical protein
VRCAAPNSPPTSLAPPSPRPAHPVLSPLRVQPQAGTCGVFRRSRPTRPGEGPRGAVEARARAPLMITACGRRTWKTRLRGAAGLAGAARSAPPLPTLALPRARRAVLKAVCVCEGRGGEVVVCVCVWGGACAPPRIRWPTASLHQPLAQHLWLLPVAFIRVITARHLLLAQRALRAQ